MTIQVYAAIEDTRSHPFFVNHKHAGWIDAPRDGKLARIRTISSRGFDFLLFLNGTEYKSFKEAETALLKTTK